METCWRDEVCWPGPQARQAIQNQLRTSNPNAASILPSTVGFVDGTLIPFRHSPGFKNKDEKADVFNHRKQRYGFQATIIADDMRRITCFNSQWPGSVNDARAVTSLAMWNSPEEYFSGDEIFIETAGDCRCAASC